MPHRIGYGLRKSLGRIVGDCCRRIPIGVCLCQEISICSIVCIVDGRIHPGRAITKIERLARAIAEGFGGRAVAQGVSLGAIS